MIYIVLGLAANKFDLFKQQQQVTENEGKQYAEKIGAVFSSTSAKENIGIEPLFNAIGERIYESINQSDDAFEESLQKTKIIYRDSEKKKKGCCKVK